MTICQPVQFGDYSIQSKTIQSICNYFKIGLLTNMWAPLKLLG